MNVDIHEVFKTTYLTLQVELAWDRKTCFLQPSLSLIAFGSSSFRHPVSSISWFMNVFFDLPCVRLPWGGSHSKTSPASSSLLRKQCPANLSLCC